MLDHAHRQGLRDVIGFATRLDDRADGLHGTFQLLDDVDGDKAIELVRQGVLSGVSAAFAPIKSRIRADGVVERVKMRLEKVALCRQGAYDDARVLALRAD
jgi:HK97 family phage prohead protease